MSSLKHQTISGNMKTFVALAAILLVGLFFRLHNLAAESLWHDEIITLRIVKQDLSRMMEILWVKGKEANPPLYYIFLHGWAKLFGTSEFALRFPSVIFGVLGIFAIYKVGSLIFNLEAGFLSALLLALSVFHISYSQEARMYALFVLLTLFSFYFLIRMLKFKGRAAPACYVLFTVLLMYCHTYGLFAILAQNIFFFTAVLLTKNSREMSLKKWILLQGILLAFFLPWVRTFLGQLSMVRRDFWIAKPTLKTLKNTFIEYTDSKKLSLLLAAFAVSAYFPYHMSRRHVLSRRWNFFPGRLFSQTGSADFSYLYLLALWLFVPVLLPFLSSLVTTPIYIARYTAGASSAFFLLAAQGIARVNSRLLKFTVISLAMASCLLNIKDYYMTVRKEEWRSAADFVDSNARQGDLLFVNDERDRVLLDCFGYYSRDSDLFSKHIFTKEMLTHPGKEDDRLALLMKDSRRAWLILSKCMMDKAVIVERFSSLFKRSSRYRFEGIDVYLFEK